MLKEKEKHRLIFHYSRLEKISAYVRKFLCVYTQEMFLFKSQQATHFLIRELQKSGENFN